MAGVGEQPMPSPREVREMAHQAYPSNISVVWTPRRCSPRQRSGGDQQASRLSLGEGSLIETGGEEGQAVLLLALQPSCTYDM